jgi:anti-sigma regulatory factor (Ser/Thr protein kinase)
VESALSGTSRSRRLRLASHPTAPRQARDFLAATCALWAAERFLETGGLVLSELVSNAVMHAGTEVEVELQLTGDRLRMSVHDDGPGLPRVVPAHQRTIGGHGLDIVSRIAESWGVAPDPAGGKSVWCVLQAAEVSTAAR